MIELIRALLSSKLTTLLALVAVLAGVLADPQWLGVIPQDWAAMLTTIGAIAAALSRGLVDADGDGVPDILQGKKGHASLKLLALLIVCAGALAFLGGCVKRAAAQPAGSVLLADARVGAVCSGPATMTGCLVSIHDSTANVSLANNVAVAKGDTLWRTRACNQNETVVIGARFVGTAPNRSNSAAVGARGTGQCTAVAGQPSPVIIVEIVD